MSSIPDAPLNAEDIRRAEEIAAGLVGFEGTAREIEKVQRRLAAIERHAMKLWAEARGSAGPPPTIPRNSPVDAGTRVPKRPKDLQRWRATWRAVQPGWERGEGYVKLSEGLKGGALACSKETAAAIIKAGREGLLD